MSVTGKQTIFDHHCPTWTCDSPRRVIRQTMSRQEGQHRSHHFSQAIVLSSQTDKIIEYLLSRGAVDAAQIRRAARAREASKGRVDLALTRLGLVAEKALAEAYAAILELPRIAARDFPRAPVLDGEVSVPFLRNSRLLPIRVTPEAVAVAAADPLDRTAIDAIGLALGRPVEIFVGLPTDIDAAMARLFGTGPAGNAAKAEVTSQATGHDAAADIQHLQEQDTDAAAVRLLNQIIAGAVANKASDIHIEPFDQTLHIRYRVDGQLRHAAAPDKNLHRTLIGRIKILAGMDITEQRKPQDGRCRITAEGRQIDLRVSLLPSLYGESAVLRILDQDRAALDLDDLGFERALQDQIGALIRQPHGIMLICGPTGSGKTTSLYAILRQLKAEQRKIVTVEDPVEYQLEGISQIQTRPNIGLGFAEVLRSVLRHDPDVIMVGEARDAETARTAVQAALTGHLVLCSVHTNDAAGAIARLIDMGVEPYLLASTLRGVLAQRLVRRLCPACREADPHAGTLAADYADTPEIPRDGAYYRPVGCEACGQTGFTGRIAIAEYLPATATIRQCIIDRRPSSDIHDTARQAGMRSLRIDGLVKAAGGITAIQEVLGVTVE